MAAIEIGGELDFVDGDEIHLEVARHGLDGGNPIAGIFRLDLLFAGDQRHRVGTDPLDDAIVDLAGQEPQRQADDSRRDEPAFARWHNASCRCWSARAPRSHAVPAHSDAREPWPETENSSTDRPYFNLVSPRITLYHNMTFPRVVLHISNETRTNHARIADSPRVSLCSPQDVEARQARIASTRESPRTRHDRPQATARLSQTSHGLRSGFLSIVPTENLWRPHSAMLVNPRHREGTKRRRITFRPDFTKRSIEIWGPAGAFATISAGAAGGKPLSSAAAVKVRSNSGTRFSEPRPPPSRSARHEIRRPR